MSNLIGTWRLLSVKMVFSDGGESVDMYGAEPVGFLIVNPDHRMMTIITSAGREMPQTQSDEAALFGSMMGYSGVYRLEDDNKFVTHADVAWHPAWLGSEQTRIFSVNGDILSIQTPETMHPMFPARLGHGVLKWQRESPIITN